MPAGKVLVVEDDEDIQELLKAALEPEFELLVTSDSDKALHLIKRESPDLVLLDLGLPPSPHDHKIGIQLLRIVGKACPHIKVLVCTGQPGYEAASHAISLGAYDVIYKPFSVEHLQAVVRRVCWMAHIGRRLGQNVPENELLQEMVGTSPCMRQVFDMVRRVSTTDMPVLITGETGTGKELTARAIHERSQRKKGPFVPINCGAIPETLLESELYGHERGAFTGAQQLKKGKFEAADGGTLFLDEVGDLLPSLQVKLLRFLQEGTFERVGGQETLHLNTRVITATNVDLQAAIRKSMFREDLYYRLGMLHIHLPPLRERGEDTLLMAMFFLKGTAASFHGKRIPPYSREAIEAIQSYHWPGNVRELCNRVRRAVVMAEGPEITPQDLGLTYEALPSANGLDSLKAAHRRIEMEMITKAMSVHQGNLSRAAQALEVSRSTLYRKIQEFNLEEFVLSTNPNRSPQPSPTHEALGRKLLDS
ncbi:MAG: sigma-54 dependent transcriptional regulator [Nitrospira sp.]|nr:sigma-54 dependent transcriptional regulator [Nitrospira sp.]